MRRSPWAECPRCGLKVRVSDLCREWTGSRVCKDCRDPRPADTRAPNAKPEGLPVPGASPETTPIFRAEGDKGGDDL
jgi:hypothetical protein